MRIEDLHGADFVGIDVVSARALAPLDQLMHLAEPLMGERTIALFPKGQDVASELDVASRYWDYRAGLTISATEAQARIVSVSRLRRKVVGEDG
jgi:16S rRNA (guanine527-N7)-methyltransferase